MSMCSLNIWKWSPPHFLDNARHGSANQEPGSPVVLFVCFLSLGVFLIQWRGAGGGRETARRFEKKLAQCRGRGGGRAEDTCYIRHSTCILNAHLVSEVVCLLGDKWEDFILMLLYYGFALQKRSHSVGGRTRTHGASWEALTNISLAESRKSCGQRGPFVLASLV